MVEQAELLFAEPDQLGQPLVLLLQARDKGAHGFRNGGQVNH